MSHFLRRVCATVVSCGLLVLLAGCAMPRMIDSEVQSFASSAAALRPATYRFERLPSQSKSPKQEALEAMAMQALAQVGLTQAGGAVADAEVRYGVQVRANVTVWRTNNLLPPMRGFWWRSSGRGVDLFLESD